MHFELVTEFLDYVLKSDASAVTVMVCSTKQAFLQKLGASIQMQTSSQQPGEPHSEGLEGLELFPPAAHTLVSGAIGTIAMSQRITMAFCPSAEHFRAKLSLFHMPPEQLNRGQESDVYQSRPMLAILDPLAIHAGCSELSAQGLSRSLALAVEVTARENMDAVLCECPAADNEGSESGRSPWNVDIPLLNPSTDATRGERPEGAYRPVKPKQIAKRWFEFDGGKR